MLLNPTTMVNSEQTESERAPIAFLSYAHESDGHSAWVRNLATKLRGLGVDARFDQWQLSLGDDLARFMIDGVQKSDLVLVVCTPRYAAKASANQGGVGFDGSVIAGPILTQATIQTKFIPILRTGTAGESIPTFLWNRHYIDFTQDAQVNTSLAALVRHMHGRPAEIAPPIARVARTIENVQENLHSRPPDG